MRTIDKDGQYVYSEIIFISFADLVNKVQVNPNPMTDGKATVTISSFAEQNAQWKIMDQSGRVALKGTVQLRKD